MTMSPEQLVPHETEPDDAPATEQPDTETYKVVGRQPVDEVKTGGLLYLNPADPRTGRLIERGQIALVDPTQED